MKFLKRIRARLNSFLSPQPGKTGSSMAFVMIIGAVLVIWVLAIMPLMVAVGNNSLLTQGSYADYLQSRSAIEFCKGELENIVETKPPYTFCVVKNGDTYTAIPKMDSITLSDQYEKAINRDPDATDVNNINDDVDTDDVPENTAEGNSVVAICAIAQDEKEENVYNIIITTYNNGKKGLTYSTVYTIRGSLLINPESYQQSQALPLSDFVLVDGKLGSKTIWNSNIHAIAAVDFKNVTNLATIFETLLPVGNEAQADAGEYPAVLKTTAYPSGVTRSNPLDGFEFVLVSTSNNAVYCDGNSLKVQKNFDISNYRNNPDDPSFDKYQWKLEPYGNKYRLYNENADKYLKETYTNWWGIITYSYSLTDNKSDATKFTITYNNGSATIKADRYLNITDSTVEPSDSSTSILMVTGTTEGTPVDSVLKGASLYFMGREGSIDTKDKTIYLHTDLIVLRHDIKSNGSVMVYPYSDELNTYDPNDTDPDTLLFAVNDIKNSSGAVVFKALTFYRIPANTDINRITADDAKDMHPLKISYDKENKADMTSLRQLFRSGDYPDTNMDIAYVDRENSTDRSNDGQLAHIVSGETIGWTNNGRMEDGDDRNSSNNSTLTNANSKFIVCAFVTSVKNAEIKRTANRIMLAAEETLESGYESKTLRVTNNLHFTCRYLSISADYIIQNGNNNYFKIKNLGQDETFIGLILKFFDIKKYSSKTMQIEFEQTVCIQNKSGVLLSRQKPAGIYRIEHPDLDNDSDEGVNLFQSYANPDSDYTAPALTVKYTNDEIKDLFNRAFSLKSRFVERYVSIDGGDTNYLEVSLIVKRELYIYANYISFENDIVGYKLKGWKRDGAIIINSQERGYAAEYTGFFGGGSAESYTGTIIHIASNDENSTREKNGIYVEDTFLPAGFYYIPASEDGTNINKLAEVADDEYGTIDDIDKIHRIDPAKLEDYSIYIDPKTGAMSDAYVDTGLIGNGNLGESGFSGGNVG